MFSITILHGYLGRDPELVDKTGQNGSYKQVKFTLGVSRNYGDETDWYFCYLNGSRAEVIEKYFHKGSQILVAGRIEKYKDKNNDKITREVLRILDFDFCDKNEESTSTSNSKPSTSQTQTSTERSTESMEEVDEDVPF